MPKNAGQSEMTPNMHPQGREPNVHSPSCSAKGGLGPKSKARTAVLVLSLVLGLCAAAVIRAYPEVISSKGTFGPRDSERVRQWRHRTSRCSLLDVLREGFRYEPLILDGREIRHRSPTSLLWYLLIIPLCSVSVYLAIRLGSLAGSYWRQSMAGMFRSRPRRVFAALVGLAILSHIVRLLYMMPLGLASLDPWWILARTAGLVHRILLPLTIVNGYLLFGFSWLNTAVIRNTSPRIGFPIMPQRSPYDGIRYNGLLWEGLCVVLLVFAWVLIIGMLCDLFAHLHAMPGEPPGQGGSSGGPRRTGGAGLR